MTVSLNMYTCSGEMFIFTPKRVRNNKTELGWLIFHRKKSWARPALRRRIIFHRFRYRCAAYHSNKFISSGARGIFQVR